MNTILLRERERQRKKNPNKMILGKNEEKIDVL